MTIIPARPLARIISVTAAGHRASRRVMEKCGLTFQTEVTFRAAQVAWYAIDRPPQAIARHLTWEAGPLRR